MAGGGPNSAYSEALTSLPRRRERFLVAVLLLVYAGWIAWITGKTPLHPLPDELGAGQLVFNLQAAPSLVAAATALADAGLGGRVALVRWTADLSSLVVVWVIAGFAVVVGVVDFAFAVVPAGAALLLVFVVLRGLSRRLKGRY